MGDGETDEPETLGAISLASREGLDNLIWVVNCNLQRLDGPVRGNGQIIQRARSASFAAPAGTCIKVIWGSGWDRASRAKDHDGASSFERNGGQSWTVEYQRYKSSPKMALTSATTSSARTRRTKEMVDRS